jgi:ATP/maltotriose-dependent transcriptional regulator MalT
MINELLEKGRQALSEGKWETAKNILEKALSEKETAEICEELSWAYWWLNDAVSVFETRTRAYNLFLRNNNNYGASRTACWIGLDYIEFKGEFAVASGWFQRAEKLLEGLPESPELAMIKLLKARWSFQVEKNSNLAHKLIGESLKISKSLNNLDGEMVAEALKGFILVVEGKVSEGMPLLDDATLLAVTSEKGDIKFTTITCCYLIDACERIRDYERASQWCNNVKEICKRWDYKAMFANCRVKYAGVLMWQGDWKGAEEELLSASSELKSLRPVQVNACTVRLADLKRRQGKWTEAEALLNKAESHPLVHLYSAYLFYDRGEYEKALNMAERYLRKFAPGEKAERTAVVDLLVRIYIKLERFEQAETMLNELRETAAAINTSPLKAALLNAEGNYNLVKKNYETARKNFEHAVDIYDSISSPYDAAKCRLNLSEVLINMKQHSQAEAELTAAENTFKQLSAEKDIERTRYALKNLYKKNSGYKSDYEFTGRELEVLRLIAGGRNNEDIAEKLFLSVRTVEKHLTNIYSKMGVSGKSARAYAASYTIKNNLI